ncbi:MAG TPA: histidine phosphatase family protein [Acidimicrobiales bacterium]|jgi:probable phosphoglycerate mutase
MSEPGEIIVVRHGQTAANAQGLLLGRLDVDLDDVGRAQAMALAAALPDPDMVVTSPLARTRQTAAAFGGDVDLEVDERWIEMDYGDFDGRPVADVPNETWSRWRADVDFAPPGGESLARMTARVHDALDDLVVRVSGRRVVVVTHVSPIKAAVGWALEIGPEVSWRTFVAPASITRVGVGPNGPTLRSFNETMHLAPPTTA